MKNRPFLNTLILALMIIFPLWGMSQKTPYLGYSELDLSVDVAIKENVFNKLKQSIESGVAQGINEKLNLLTLAETLSHIEANKIKNYEKVALKSLVVWDIDRNEANLLAFSFINTKDNSLIVSCKGEFEAILGKKLYQNLRKETIKSFLSQSHNSKVNALSSVAIEYQKNDYNESIPRSDSLETPDSLTYRLLPYSKLDRFYLGKAKGFEEMIKEFFRNGILTPYSSEILDTPLAFSGYQSLLDNENEETPKHNEAFIITENWIQTKVPLPVKETSVNQFNPMYPLLKKKVYSIGLIINNHRLWVDYDNLKGFITNPSFKEDNSSKYAIQFSIFEMIIASSFCEKINLIIDFS